MTRQGFNSFSMLLLLLFLTAYLSVETVNVNSEETAVTRFVPVELLRSDEQEEHVFLDPQESVTFNASGEVDGLGLVKIDVLSC